MRRWGRPAPGGLSRTADTQSGAASLGEGAPLDTRAPAS
ncbi:hypothetical protein C725_0632 [Pacificimonas flava]|uniref:Uncharacterized protein n=1 Tax=Pacificimonas flava TaxID=1234595 RepID=M2SE73_9SPHN|nr:hypothetical protein C725_0632 [Pacificimonas flava]